MDAAPLQVGSAAGPESAAGPTGAAGHPRHAPLSRKGGVRLAMYALGLAAFLIGKGLGCTTAELVTLAGMLATAIGGDTYRPSGMSG